MRVHRGKALVAGVAVLALGVSACGSGGGGDKDSGGGSGQAIYGESTEFPGNLFPIIAAGNSTAIGNLVPRVLNGLYRVSPEIAYTPDTEQGTASSAVVGGQQVVTVKINKDAKWDDGKPITSDDYEFTWSSQKSLDPKQGGCASILSSTGFDQIQKADKPSSKEIKFTFKKGQSYADWKGLFSGSSALILSKHVLDKGSVKATCANFAKGWPTKGGIPAGASNGPWVLSAKNVDTAKKTITLTPNKNYWGPKPKLARLVYQTIGSTSDTNIKALQNGDVNIIYPQPQLDLVAGLKRLTGVKSEVNFGVSFEHLDFNVKDPLLKYKEVRQAIAYAADRKALVSKTVGKFSDKAQVLGNRILLNNQKGYEDHSGEYATQNIAKAKQLIGSNPGAKMGSDGYWRINGKQLSFRVMTTQENPLRDQTITTLAAQVKEAGIKFTEFANADIFEDKSKPTSLESEGFQIALFAWVGTPSLSSNNAIYLTRSKGGGQNYSQGSSAKVDSALVKGARALSLDDEYAAYNEADKALWDEMYTLPLYQKPTLLAFQDNIKGIADNPTLAGPLWNSDTFSLK